MTALRLLVWPAAVWVALWGDPTVANVTAGLVVAVVLAAAFPPARPARRSRLRPVETLRLLGWFARELVVASARVAWAAVAPGDRVREAIVACPLRGASDLVTTVVANAITLTPGTLTVEVDRDPVVLYVHVLQLGDVESVRADARHLEALAIRAFGDDEAVARLDREAAGKEVPWTS